MSHRFNLSDWTLHHRTLVGYFLFAIALMGVISRGYGAAELRAHVHQT